MLAAFRAELRKHLDALITARIDALRRCETLEGLCRAQGALDALDASRQVIDEVYEEFHADNS